MFLDNVKSRRLGADGVYRRCPAVANEPPMRGQDYLQAEARRATPLARDAAGVSFTPEEKG
jgi:hypothetical protein